MVASVDDMHRQLTTEQGKPPADARQEILGAAMMLKAHAARELPMHQFEDSATRSVETRYVPIGVVGAIAPWNFPIFLVILKLGPGLPAGNCLVLKPSPFPPLTTLKFGELVRAILPPGVHNGVSGGDSLGPWLTAHPGIDNIAFTGSSQTGKRVMERAASSLQRVTLELGGNDAAIVVDDVDVDAVAQKLFRSAFGNNGQVCMATRRLYVHDDIHDRCCTALTTYARTARVGDGAKAGRQLGPINNRAQYDRVVDLIRDARSKGYRFLLGDDEIDSPGYFVPITILDNPPENSRIVREEQFGPVLPLIRFDDVETVISQANDSQYGFAGSVWSGDENRALAIAERLATGTVFINQTPSISPFAPFGGHKQSGLGVESGVDGPLEYTNSQTIARAKGA